MVFTKQLKDLKQTQVDQAYKLIIQLIEEEYPDIDVRKGAVRDLVIYLASVLTAWNQNNIDELKRSLNIQEIIEHPELANKQIVDLIASNNKTYRRSSSAAYGSVILILNQPRETFIPNNTLFTTADGVIVTSTQTFIGRLSKQNVLSASDRLITKSAKGVYSFTVDVTSLELGKKGRLTAGTKLALPVIDPNIIIAQVKDNFKGGAEEESNDELMKRMQNGNSSKSLAHRPGIKGLIENLDLPMFDNSLAISIIGFGDKELQRYHGLFPIAFGGRVDVYVRTHSQLHQNTIIKKGISTSEYQATHKITLACDDIPGMYEIQSVTTPEQGSHQIVRIDHDFDTTKTSIDIATSTEAAFSSFRTANIWIYDPDFQQQDKDYEVRYSAMTGIKEIQEVVSDKATSYPIGDCLIKAPVPCMLKVHIGIWQRSFMAEPNITLLQNKIADTINGLGFVGRIPVSLIIAKTHEFLNNVVVTSASISGRLCRPDGKIIDLTSNTILDIGHDPLNMVTSKTVSFFLDPSDVIIDMINIDN